MSDEYSERFSGRTASSNKPECYGDIDIYDTADEECIECPVKRSCRVVVDKKLVKAVRDEREDKSERPSRTRRSREKEKERKSTRRKKRDLPAPPTDKYRDPALKEDTFFWALMYNSFLTAIESVLQEASYGVESIPRVRYPNPFRKRDDDD